MKGRCSSSVSPGVLSCPFFRGTPTRALDRAAGTDISGAYPQQRDGTSVNPPGTALGRTYDRVTGDDVSGAYPQNQRRGTRAY